MKFFVSIFLIFLVQQALSLPEEHASGRIIGGSIAQPFQFPYQAALNIIESGGKFHCSGSLISKNYVLSVAQCLKDAIEVEVLLGVHDLSGNDALWRQTFPKNYIKIHEAYDSVNIDNDIALIKVCGVTLIPGKVETVKIIPRSLQNENFIGKSVRASGWGRYQNGGPLSTVLRYVDLTVKDLQVCRDFFTNPITISSVCVTGQGKNSICGGDAAAPLMIKSGSDDYLIGLGSWISKSGCELSHPQGFTRIASFLDWIEKNTDVNCKCSKWRQEL